MVYVTEGKVYPGHRPRVGNSYARETTKFRLEEMPVTAIPQAQVAKDKYHLIVCAACPWVCCFVESESSILYLALALIVLLSFCVRALLP